MLIAVLGVSGSGKTTFATKLAEATGIPQIELDLLNLRPGWVSRYEEDFEGMVRDLDDAIAQDAWVLAGGYSKLRERILTRADTVVWLALPKWLVMWQVFSRSFMRAAFRQPILNGNVETFSRWPEKGHPIQIAWQHYKRKNKQIEDLVRDPRFNHLTVYRCAKRKDVRRVLSELSALAVSPE